MLWAAVAMSHGFYLVYGSHHNNTYYIYIYVYIILLRSHDYTHQAQTRTLVHIKLSVLWYLAQPAVLSGRLVSRDPYIHVSKESKAQYRLWMLGSLSFSFGHSIKNTEFRQTLILAIRYLTA